MHTHHNKHATLAQSGPTGPSTAMQTTVSAGDKNRNAQVVSGEAIRLCAYRKWERAGKPTGNGIQFWLEAEQELIADTSNRAAQQVNVVTHDTAAHDHSQDADRHSKTRHVHSEK